jgi:hypothetical protein
MCLHELITHPHTFSRRVLPWHRRHATSVKWEHQSMSMRAFTWVVRESVIVWDRCHSSPTEHAHTVHYEEERELERAHSVSEKLLLHYCRTRVPHSYRVMCLIYQHYISYITLFDDDTRMLRHYINNWLLTPSLHEHRESNHSLSVWVHTYPIRHEGASEMICWCLSAEIGMYHHVWCVMECACVVMLDSVFELLISLSLSLFSFHRNEAPDQLFVQHQAFGRATRSLRGRGADYHTQHTQAVSESTFARCGYSCELPSCSIGASYTDNCGCWLDSSGCEQSIDQVCEQTVSASCWHISPPSLINNYLTSTHKTHLNNSITNSSIFTNFQ